MYILGIESSCDETAASVIKVEEENITVLSNIVATQIATHALFGGVVPEIASREHIKSVSYVIDGAIKEANIDVKSLDAIGVTYGPGLIGSLLVGVSFAKSMAASLNIPLINVNHIKAHASAAYVTNDIKAPYLALVVSGGHTSIYRATSAIDFEEIATTRDDAAGEAFDKVARVMGLNYPGGKEMDTLAREGFDLINNSQGEFIHLPSPAINDDTLDFSFSGLKTATVNYIHNYRQKNSLDDKAVLPHKEMAIIAASFTKTIVEGICVKLKYAIEKFNPNTIVLAGGVAANSHLRQGITSLCNQSNVTLSLTDLKYCGDNGVMVAVQTYFDFCNGTRADSYLNAYATGDIDI